MRKLIALQTGRDVLLRRPVLEDQEAFLELVAESRKLHRPFVQPPTTAEGFQRYVHRSNRLRHSHHVVCRVKDGALVGVFNLSEIVRGPLDMAFLGYYASARLAGKGYMSQGLKLLLRQAFERYKLHRLEAHIQPENVSSIALVERAGFRFEGTSPRFLKVGGRWRDHRRYAIDRDEWRQWMGRPARRVVESTVIQ